MARSVRGILCMLVVPALAVSVGACSTTELEPQPPQVICQDVDQETCAREVARALGHKPRDRPPIVAVAVGLACPPAHRGCGRQGAAYNIVLLYVDGAADTIAVTPEQLWLHQDTVPQHLAQVLGIPSRSGGEPITRWEIDPQASG